jgi:serine/threonine protein kinase
MSYLRKYRKNVGTRKSILRIVSQPFNSTIPNAYLRCQITDAALGLQYLHNRHPPVVHSGMKGDNILITDSGGAVLGGFGLTKVSIRTNVETMD